MAEESPRPGSFVRVEIRCQDVKRARAFYGKVFGLRFDDVPDMDDTRFNPASPPGGGLTVPQEGGPKGVLNYILVDSIEETTEQIEGAGGKVVVPRNEVPGFGWYAVFEDPEESLLAPWKSARGPG